MHFCTVSSQPSGPLLRLYSILHTLVPLDSLLPYLLLDFAVVIAVIVTMFRRMAFWHPLTAYLFFHLYSFTYRAVKLFTGDASPLYTGVPNTEVITAAELERALIWADVGLVVFTAASWLAHVQFEANASRPVVRRVMNPDIAKFLGVLCLPIGLYFFAVLKSGNLELEAGAAGTGYLQAVALWPIGVVGLLVFAFGFRWHLLIIGGFFLGGVALQGYHRFMLVLPLLFFTAYYLQTRRLRWPTWPILLGALVFALVFPRLKYIGQAVQAGDNQEAWAQFTESFTFSSREKGESGGEDFLDQYAGALALADTNGRSFNGSTYLAIVTLPIPRAWWPNKPGLADHLQEISTSGRNYAAEGRIITYLAEAYLNFGYLGLFAIPALVGYVLTACCQQATSGPMLRLGRYVYLVFFMALVQTFRDGLLSIFVFTVVHNMPMLFTWILHYVPGLADRSLDRPPSDPLALEEESDA